MVADGKNSVGFGGSAFSIGGGIVIRAPIGVLFGDCSVIVKNY